MYFKKIENHSYRNDTTKRFFWFDSGIHGREWTTINLAIHGIDQVKYFGFKSFSNKLKAYTFTLKAINK